MEENRIKFETFIVTRPDVIYVDGLLKKNPQPPYDIDTISRLMHYIQKNQFFIITYNAPLIDAKNPFELFFNEIYRFKNKELISDLTKTRRFLISASEALSKYLNNQTKPESYMAISNFLIDIKNAKEIIEKIFLDGYLEKICNEDNSK